MHDTAYVVSRADLNTLRLLPPYPELIGRITGSRAGVTL